MSTKFHIENAMLGISYATNIFRQYIGILLVMLKNKLLFKKYSVVNQCILILAKNIAIDQL